VLEKLSLKPASVSISARAGGEHAMWLIAGVDPNAMADRRRRFGQHVRVVLLRGPFFGVVGGSPDGSRATHILRLDALHQRVLHLLGPAYENCYLARQQTAE
jgi:hypothetical protein